MQYNYNFSACSIIFMTMTALFYLTQKRIRDSQDKLFTLMMIGGLVSVVFDFASALMEWHATLYPVWLLATVNALFIFGEQLCLPAFLLYTIASAEKYRKLSKIGIAAILLPFLVMTAGLILSFFTKVGIFYIDSDHIYRQGAIHMLLYINVAIYFIASVAVLSFNLKVIPKIKKWIIFVFITVILCAAIVQIFFPKYLVTASATAIALSGMFFAMRTPGEQIDPATGVFARATLPNLIRIMREKNRSFTLLLFSLANADELVRAFGTKVSDEAILALATYLKEHFKGCEVASAGNAEFTVLSRGKIEYDEYIKLKDRLPRSFGSTAVSISAAALLCDGEGTGEADILSAEEAVYLEMHEGGAERLYYADEETQKEYLRRTRFAQNCRKYLDEGVLELCVDDVRSKSGRVVCRDATLLVRHSDIDGITTRDIFNTLAKSGLSERYYDELIIMLGRLAEEEPEANKRQMQYCMPVGAAMLMRDGAAEAILMACERAGLETSRMLVGINESEAANALPTGMENLNKLFEKGFSLRLDNFAEGYTDMSLLTRLPFKYVCIDGNMLANAAKSERGTKLLESVINVIHGVGKLVACSGASTPELRRIAIDAGADYTRIGLPTKRKRRYS